jgi:hypothetical protein
MKNSSDGTTSAARRTKPKQLAPISERKQKANRENAKKSTGPNTSRGKAFSRRNALKHGLLTKDVIPGFPLQGENPQEFRKLFDDLMHDHKPCGAAEELEVAQIAACRWRLKRAWRYENAEIQLGQVKALSRGNIPPPMSDEYKTALRLLQDAQKEIEAGKEISQELKEKVFAALPSFQERWPWAEQRAHQFAEEECQRWAASFAGKTGISVREVIRVLDRAPDPLFDRRRVAALTTIRIAIRMIELECKLLFDSVMKHMYELEAIPNRDVIEKLLRYETGFERSLDRAVDRLERLQRYRKGEPVPTR